MNHIKQNRAATDFAAPGTFNEIVVGFEEHCATHDCNNRPESASIYDLPCLGHDRTVCAVVANENFRICCVCDFDQPLGLRNGGCDWLFKQYWQSRLDTYRGMVDVELVW